MSFDRALHDRVSSLHAALIVKNEIDQFPEQMASQILGVPNGRLTEFSHLSTYDAVTMFTCYSLHTGSAEGDDFINFWDNSIHAAKYKADQYKPTKLLAG